MPRPILPELIRGNISNLLTHWGRDKMTAILQTTHSNALENVRISIKCSPVFFMVFLILRRGSLVSSRVMLNNVDRCSGLILGLRQANERRRYKVTPSLIGWAQT